MSPVVLLIALATTPDPEWRSVDAGPRPPVALWVRRNAGFTGAPTRSELVRATALVLERELFVRVVDESSLAVRTCRTVSAEEAPTLYCHVLVALRTPGISTLISVAAIGEGDRSRVRLGATDLEPLRGLIERTEDGVATTPLREDRLARYDRALARILENTRFDRRRPAADRAALTAALEAALQEPLADRLGEARRARSTGLAVTTASVARLTLDERDLPNSTGRLRVTGLEPGAHRLEARAEGFYPERWSGEVMAGETRTVELTLRRDHGTAWRVSGWVGAGLLAAGAATAVWGVVEAGGRPRAGVGDSRLLRLVGPSSSTLPGRLDEHPAGDGPIVAGLAAGLGATGALLLTSGLLADEPTEPPWWMVALSVAAGAVVYGSFELADAAR